ncbi:YbcC family protein [Lignipirellula cremea]|uniref:Probable inorganic carbon transporter subunit DabA n=1 Tax=Lignipirellula cremea TaxID=2528010 RepID=A0A518DKL2_9BACT|nr:DUF2309 domain-containing protein [Lignipirellula cremea]QDU92369.1 hypothetical protein Pla8534_01150 [Lignipirellula cremea]
MSQAISSEPSLSNEAETSLESVNTVHPRLSLALSEVLSITPPLWPLQEYVAVNPFLGLTENSFLEARHLLREVRDCELLPSLNFYRSLVAGQKISQADIRFAWDHCCDAHPDLFADFSFAELIARLEPEDDASREQDRDYYTVAELVDHQLYGDWTNHIVNDISRYCAAHYDEGQAAWPSPWKDLSLYAAWRHSAQVSRRMEQLGIPSFRDWARQLPTSPAAAIAQSLSVLQVPHEHWRSFLLCEMFSIGGWASFVKQQSKQPGAAASQKDDLLGLLAIRLAYDAALYQAQDAEFSLPFKTPQPVCSDRHVLSRYLLMVAHETSFRKEICDQLTTAKTQPTGRKSAQLVFCIDVRSEGIRRQLEAVSDEVETFGFAGFFGMPFEYIRLGESNGEPQCPVLLSPSFQVNEALRGGTREKSRQFAHRLGFRKAGRKIRKAFQTSAVACFSFVESIGLWYGGKLLTDSLGLNRSASQASGGDGLLLSFRARTGPDVDAEGANRLSLARKTELATGLLRNLGLTRDFAKIVAFCGHSCSVSNNPYKSALDCGACGGRSGQPNARVAASILNDPEVRTQLGQNGIAIPDDTWFVPAVHNTTIEQIQFFDDQNCPEDHSADLAQLKTWAQEASQLRLEERARQNGTTVNAIVRGSGDWSEIRAEWGLAGNAAFIAAPRSRTQNSDLKGRAFLHSYDAAQDPDGKVLELIMTAPLIVAHWINLQYFASTVDNRAFGSGNKTIHNVVGQIGVLQGNGGDLMTGLPWQSLHDGQNLQHQPLRLLAVIETSRAATQQIIDRHPMLQDLFNNGWMSLVVLEGEQLYRKNSAGEWCAEDRTPPGLESILPHSTAAHSSSSPGAST